MEQLRLLADWLLSVGEGAGTTPKVSLPAPYCLPSTAGRTGLIHSVFDLLFALDPLDQQSCLDYFADRVVLAAHNEAVDVLNGKAISLMPGTATTYRSADSAMLQDETAAGLPEEYLNSLPLTGFPPHCLHVKLGAPVILLRNLDPQQGLCNGTRLVVTRMETRVLGCRILSGSRRGEDVALPRIRLVSNPTSQFPFKSLRHVGLDLTLPVFSHGQLYVGLSRSTALDSIKILLPETAEHTETANVVYREVFMGYDAREG